MTTEDIKDMDPNILVSIINLKLRDYYSSLENLCEDMDIDMNVLESSLGKGGFSYNEDVNQFKQLKEIVFYIKYYLECRQSRHSFVFQVN